MAAAPPHLPAGNASCSGSQISQKSLRRQHTRPQCTSPCSDLLMMSFCGEPVALWGGKMLPCKSTRPPLAVSRHQRRHRRKFNHRERKHIHVPGNTSVSNNSTELNPIRWKNSLENPLIQRNSDIVPDVIGSCGSLVDIISCYWLQTCQNKDGAGNRRSLFNLFSQLC